MNFKERKERAMEALSSELPDKSRKGGVDAPIVPLITFINDTPCFYTTSSCSGRISILQQFNTNTSTDIGTGTGTAKSKKKAGDWIFISHETADPDHVADLVFSHTFHRDNGLTVFRFEPFILAVDCLDISYAHSLVSLAISSGFRESGITNVGKRVMVAIRCSIRLEVPIVEDGHILVSKDYIKYLVNAANRKMEANKTRTELFCKNFEKQLSEGFESNTEIREISVKKKFTSALTYPKNLMNLGDLKLLEKRQHNILSHISALERRAYCCNNFSAASFNDNGSYEEGFPFEGSELQSYHSSQHSGCPVLRETACQSSSANTCYSEPLIASKFKVKGESLEKLFRWGHSSCVMNLTSENTLVIFGGFGGLGRHSRKNDILLLNIDSGSLECLDAGDSPSPRMGHTASLIEHNLVIIGGREDPRKATNDVWLLNLANPKWHLLESKNVMFPPRHRHTAVVVGSAVYVFGGLNDDKIFGDLFILDINTHSWKEVKSSGEVPSARHSHSLIVVEKTIYLYGGHDGYQALEDLYSFDVETKTWKKLLTQGNPPGPRFSHSMFAFHNHLAILGGCPLTHQSRKLFLLNLQNLVWDYKSISCNDCFLVRGTVNVIDEELIMVGGGSSCYAFGTKFNEPLQLHLGPLKKFFKEKYCNLKDEHESDKNGLQRVVDSEVRSSANHFRVEKKLLSEKTDSSTVESFAMNAQKKNALQRMNDDATLSNRWIVKLQKPFAKKGKDLLKKVGWLDPFRKARVSDEGAFICFPITEAAAMFLQNKDFNTQAKLEETSCQCKTLNNSNEINNNLLSLVTTIKSYNGSVINEEICSRKTAIKSPKKALQEAVLTLIKKRGLSLSLMEEVPLRWERLGDMAVLPMTSFKDDNWTSLGQEFWTVVASILGVNRIARQGRVASTDTRDSTLELLYGESGWVEHRENGILYCFDATKCMFSSGNISEKLRMAKMDCRNEIVVDLFAGIGYFVLPFLLKAGAKLVYACEWNPDALLALRHNVTVNGVESCCITLEGDNRLTAPKGVADRVCLGLLPSSELSWHAAVRALRPEGGILHVHENVKDTEEDIWIKHLISTIENFALVEGHKWNVNVNHVERVKWYAPHIRHLVADVRCELA